MGSDQNSDRKNKTCLPKELATPISRVSNSSAEHKNSTNVTPCDFILTDFYSNEKFICKWNLLISSLSEQCWVPSYVGFSNTTRNGRMRTYSRAPKCSAH